MLTNTRRIDIQELKFHRWAKQIERKKERKKKRKNKKV